MDLPDTFSVKESKDIKKGKGSNHIVIWKIPTFFYKAIFLHIPKPKNHKWQEHKVLLDD